MNEERDSIFPAWCVLEIMGHRRLGGFVREVQVAGAGFLRIDVPAGAGGAAVTQLYPPASIYGITPCSEEAARAVAASNQPEPVHAWEIRAAKALPAEVEDAERDYLAADDDLDDEDEEDAF